MTAAPVAVHSRVLRGAKPDRRDDQVVAVATNPKSDLSNQEAL